LHVTGAALGDNLTALGARRRAELDDPVGGADDLPLVLHDDDRVAVAGQGGDHLVQALDIARVQPHGRLVEHVQQAGGARVHRRGELDALPLAG